MRDLKILYAEDNDKIRDAYALVLKRNFKMLIEAVNGEEALELYHHHKPDIVLTDINMPVLDGLEFVRTIRKTDQTTKIIVLSAYSDQDKLMKAIPLGLFAYLVKPIKGDDFKKVLLDAASASKETKQLHLPNGYIFDIDGRKLYYGSKEIELTMQELTMLDMLTNNMPNPVSYELLSYSLWDEYHGENKNKIQNIIKRLRKKLPELISSVYGFGYKIKE